MLSYITYDLEALQDIKLAKTNMQIDSQESMEYITGSAIRGAFIYKYIKKNGGIDINQEIHREKLLKGGIKFLNAYPLYKNQRSIPFPKCYFAKKEDIQAFNGSLEIVSGLDKGLSQGFKKVRLSDFAGYDDGEYIRLKIDKNTNLHINKQKEKNKLFRYESIKKGQVFKGTIKVEDREYIQDVTKLIEDSIVYIGGSKGSGYGKCSISNIQIVDYNPEYKIFEEKNDFNEDIYLIAMSDIIYRNELGEHKTLIDAAYIGRELGLKDVSYIDSAIETKSITSFNNKWNCHLPQIIGIKAGSVFKYKITEAIDKGVLEAFMNKGIGERKADGFGRFIIVDSFGDSSLYENVTKGKMGKVDFNIEKMSIKLNLNEEKQLQNIIDKIFEERMKRDINRRVIEFNKEMKNQDNFKSSQWGNFKDLFTYMLYQEPEVGVEAFDEYVKHANQKRNKSYKQLQKVMYKDMSFMTFLEDFVAQSKNLEQFYQNTIFDSISLGWIKSKIDSNFLYKYNIKILIELCRFQIRRSDKQ